MGQTNFDNVGAVGKIETGIHEGAHAVSNLFSEEANQLGRAATKALAGAAALGVGAGIELGRMTALPSLDLTGFNQEAPHQSEGGIRDLWHSVKHAFVKDESLDDRLHNHVESKMTPEERKNFKAENKAMDEYRAKELAWAASTMLPPPPYPVRPETPMHTELERRVKELEKNLTTEVRNGMSPTDLIRLDKQMSSYQQQVKEATLIKNPYGTGEPFRPMPKPGTTIQDYYARVAEHTEKYLQSH